MTNLLISLLFPMMMASMPLDSIRINQDTVFDKKNCTFKGIPLYGKVQVVEYCEDFKVRVVTVGEDIRVKKDAIYPTKCGEWEMVDTYPDFTIRFVDVGEDFTIRLVDTAPGID